MKYFQKNSQMLKNLLLKSNYLRVPTNGKVHKNNGESDMMNIKDNKIFGIVDLYIYFNEFIIKEGKF